MMSLQIPSPWNKIWCRADSKDRNELSVFFVQYWNGTDSHSIGENSVKVEQIGNFFHVNKWQLF